jgi:hypothetical protein
VTVPAGLEERSRELLREDRSALLDELFGSEPDASALPEGVCPRCGAPQATDLQKQPGLLFQITGRPFWAARWRCPQCRHRWK